VEVYKDYIAPLLPLVAIGISVAGWFVVSGQNDGRELRKDIRALINELRNLVLDVETRAFAYYQLSTDKSHEAGMLLKQQLQHVSVRTTSLTHQNAKFDVSASLAKFRQAVTGGDFESFIRVPRKSSDPLMNAIVLAGQEFLDDLERIFAEQYSRKK